MRKRDWILLAIMVGAFAGCWFLPVEGARFDNPVGAALRLLRSYAREHVLLCLVPALFIAGAISTFISQAAVMRYLGPGANKLLAYGVASVAGAALAVCSCTVLPLFAGIYAMGAGLGPACAFLYSGPAINVLAIVLTAGVLGPALGAARAVSAVAFAVMIGAIMHLLHRRQERSRAQANAHMPVPAPARPLWKNAMVLAGMVAILVFANWARSGQVRAVFLCCPGGLQTYQVVGTEVARDERTVTIRDTSGQEHRVGHDELKGVAPADEGSANYLLWKYRFAIASLLVAALLAMLAAWFTRADLAEWGQATWGLARKILLPLLLGVLGAGLLFGTGNQAGLIPRDSIARAVGGNSVSANLFSALAGAIMYFATLTEVPIVQGLLKSGMGSGPALAMLLAGPAVSLPSLLVIRSVIGTRKALVYVGLVVVMATITGMAFGLLRG